MVLCRHLRSLPLPSFSDGALTIVWTWIWCSRRGQSYHLCKQSTVSSHWSPDVENPSTTCLAGSSLTASLSRSTSQTKDRSVRSCTEMVNCPRKECQLTRLLSDTETEILGSLTLLGPEDKDGTPSCLCSEHLIFKWASNRIWLSWGCHSESGVSSPSAERSSFTMFASSELRSPMPAVFWRYCSLTSMYQLSHWKTWIQ